MAAATAAARDLAGDPPESTLLRVGGEVAWPDVYDRDDSLKENTNPKCILKTYGGGGGGNSSQRFSGNLKPTAAPIIGLSRKLGHGGGGGGGGGGGFRPPAIFPKKAKTGGGGRTPRAAVPDHEPGSPKVSCIGKDKKRAFDELIVDFKRTMHKSDRLSVTRTSHKYLMDVTYKMCFNF
uniref:Uncharacterized protein n=1 Tax=Oryza barthii TaxID=65489 RepID=A0A0D3HRK4_9ORYZ